jgi:hypothetical protein
LPAFALQRPTYDSFNAVLSAPEQAQVKVTIEGYTQVKGHQKPTHAGGEGRQAQQT